MKSFSCLSFVLVGLTACSPRQESRNETSPTVAAPADPAATVPAVSTPPPQGLTLPQIPQAVQNRQYDQAVQVLTELKPASAQMTDAQRLQYQQAVRDTTLLLLQAQTTDPAAKAAYDKLSRTMTGR